MNTYLSIYMSDKTCDLSLHIPQFSQNTCQLSTGSCQKFVSSTKAIHFKTPENINKNIDTGTSQQMA